MKYTTQYSFSSASASVVSADRSSFTVRLPDRAISVPREAKKCVCRMYSATIWNTSPNIVQGVNDTLSFEYPPATPLSITLLEGLYSRAALNSAIQRGLINLGITSTPFTIEEDASTNRVVLVINEPIIIDFTASQNFAEIMGFTGEIVNESVGLPKYVTAPLVAAFNQVNQFYIHSSLVDEGINESGRYNNAVLVVPINVSSGSQINYHVIHPVDISCASLIGNKVNECTFQLTNELGQTISTGGEDWSFQFEISYEM